MIRREVLHTIGALLITLGFSMIFSLAWSFYYSGNDFNAILKSLIVTVLSGTILFLSTKSKSKIELSIKDGFAIVSLGWLAMALFSSLPFYLSGYLNFTNSFFESMSGLTTTGASILGDTSTHLIEDLPFGLLFWRSFTHFIGGMGIIVFSIAILPMLGMGGVQLFRAEIAGPTADKLTPRVKQTAKLLWGIYLGFVLLLTLILKIEGMTWFDSLCHSFGTMATGGFSTKSLSIGYYSPLIQWTIMLFMLLAATNFSLHFLFLSKSKFEYHKDQEFRFYIFIAILVGMLFFTAIYATSQYSYIEDIRHSLFTSISLLTTTGYSSANYILWPGISIMLVFILLFIGGSAGSTTGGMKIVRTMLVFKYLICETKRLIHPKGIFNITIGKKNINDDVVKSTLGFYLFYIFIFIFTSLILSITGLDFITAISASASAIGNIGPGLGNIGPIDNWAHLTNVAKWVSSFNMLLGRLEIFTVMVLFSRSFWKR